MTPLSLLAVLSTAHADPRRVVVLSFDGPEPWVDTARRAVIDVVDDHHDIVPLERFTAAARRLDVVTFTPRKIAQVAKRAKVDAVVEGKVLGHDGRRVLALSVREVRSGRVVDTIEVPASGSKLFSDKSEGDDELLDLLESAEPLDEETSGWSDEPAEPMPRAPMVVSADAESTGEILDPVPASAAKSAKRKPSMFALTAAVGIAATRRQLSFASESTLAAAEQPQGMAGNPGAGLSLAAAALLVPAGLSATMSYERSVGSRLGYRDAGMVKQLPVSQRQLAVALHAGRTVKKVLGISVAIGYREMAYLISNRPGTLLIPDARYALFEFGGGLRLAFKKGLFAIGAEGSYLQALSTSGITDMTAYGKAGVTGWRGDLGVEMRATETVSVRVGGTYTRVALAFEGSGRLAHELDDDDAVDVAGAQDSYLGGYVLVGFKL